MKSLPTSLCYQAGARLYSITRVLTPTVHLPAIVFYINKEIMRNNSPEGSCYVFRVSYPDKKIIVLKLSYSSKEKRIVKV